MWLLYCLRCKFEKKWFGAFWSLERGVDLRWQLNILGRRLDTRYPKDANQAMATAICLNSRRLVFCLCSLLVASLPALDSLKSLFPPPLRCYTLLLLFTPSSCCSLLSIAQLGWILRSDMVASGPLPYCHPSFESAVLQSQSLLLPRSTSFLLTLSCLCFPLYAVISICHDHQSSPLRLELLGVRIAVHSR